MVIGEGQRRVLHQRLVEVLGVDEADVLMEHLPPTGWGDVARVSDVAAVRTDLEAFRGDLERVEGSLRGEIGSLRTDLERVEGSLRGEIGSLRGEIERVETVLRAEMLGMRAELIEKMSAQSRIVIVGMAAMVVSVVGSMASAITVLH
jgi:hypothetical protein